MDRDDSLHRLIKKSQLIREIDALKREKELLELVKYNVELSGQSDNPNNLKKGQYRFHRDTPKYIHLKDENNKLYIFNKSHITSIEQTAVNVQPYVHSNYKIQVYMIYFDVLVENDKHTQFKEIFDINDL